MEHKCVADWNGVRELGDYIHDKNDLAGDSAIFEMRCESPRQTICGNGLHQRIQNGELYLVTVATRQGQEQNVRLEALSGLYAILRKINLEGTGTA